MLDPICFNEINLSSALTIVQISIDKLDLIGSIFAGHGFDGLTLDSKCSRGYT